MNVWFNSNVFLPFVYQQKFKDEKDRIAIVLFGLSALTFVRAPSPKKVGLGYQDGHLGPSSDWRRGPFRRLLWIKSN
ncbi:hypothetical protein GCM10027046_32150 [Uliginosibacterium flavum]